MRGPRWSSDRTATGAPCAACTRRASLSCPLCSQQCYQHALRRDPDCAPAMRALKKLRAVTGGKERGEEVPCSSFVGACLLACGMAMLHPARVAEPEVKLTGHSLPD